MTITISRTELARNTRKVIEHARRTGPLVVESYGEQQAAVLDITDYHLRLKLLKTYERGHKWDSTSLIQLSSVASRG